MVGTSPESSSWRADRMFRKQLKGQQSPSHAMPKFQPETLEVIFEPYSPALLQLPKELSIMLIGLSKISAVNHPLVLSKQHL